MSDESAPGSRHHQQRERGEGMSERDVQGNRLAETEDERCMVCMGAPGDDSRRCERLAHPIHNTHLIDGVYYLPANNVEVLIDGHRECCGWNPAAEVRSTDTNERGEER